MSPLDLAQNLAESDDPEDRARGVAIVVRALTDDTPDRQGWPMSDAVVARAARHIGVEPTPELVARATVIAPTLSDAILNKAAR